MRLKLGVILIVAIISLAGISGSYALSTGRIRFNDKFEFDGCSPCGHGSVGIRDVGTGDPGPNFLQKCGKLYPINSPCDGTADPQYGPGRNDEGKNVASTISCNGRYSCAIFKGDRRTIPFFKDVTECINNAYPWYSSSFLLEFGNCGTIPVTISDITFELVSGSELLMKFIKVHNWVIKIDDVYAASGSSLNDLISNLKTVVLNSKSILNLLIDFHFEEEYEDCYGVIHEMPQQTSVKFKIDFTWTQASS